MSDTLVTKAKRIVARFNYKEIAEFENWLRKKRDKMCKIERVRRRQAECDAIKDLVPGTLVTVKDSRSHLCAKVGTITRHLRSSSPRTEVDFGKAIGVWRVPRSMLSFDISEEHLDQLTSCKGLSAVINKALTTVEGKNG